MRFRLTTLLVALLFALLRLDRLFLLRLAALLQLVLVMARSATATKAEHETSCDKRKAKESCAR